MKHLPSDPDCKPIDRRINEVNPVDTKPVYIDPVTNTIYNEPTN